MRFFKNLFTPKSDELKCVKVVELWYVRWYARVGKYGSDTRLVMEAFTSKEEAEDFAASLKAAFKLIKHTSGADVWIEKN